MSALQNTARILEELRSTLYESGALSAKTKFLIALSNCVALGCEPCTIHRLKAAKTDFDCTDQEIEEAVSLAILNSAGTTQAKFMAAWRKISEPEPEPEA